MKRIPGRWCWGALAVAGTICVSRSCAAEAPSVVGVSLDASLLSAYVWRGQVLSDEPVLQPSLTVTQEGFALNVWGNVNLTDISTEDETEYTEIDLTPSYSRKVGPVALGVGYVEYLFPHQTVTSADGTNQVAAPGTRELYVSAGLPNLIGAPTVAAYYDFDEIEGTYLMLTGGYSTKRMNDKVCPGMSACIGFGTDQYNKGYFGVDKAAFNDLTLTGSVGCTLGKNLVLTPVVQYVRLLDSEIREASKSRYKDDSQVVGSIKLSYTF